MSSGNPAILVRVERLTYRYRRAVRNALDQVDLVMGAGVTALVGPNGAGKSTLFRLLAGVLAPAHGTVVLEGEAPASYLTKRALGYLPELPSAAEYLRVRELLDGLARLTRTKTAFRFGTLELADLRLGDLSLGQRRRVELAAALIGDPAIVLLDEPANGLDPLGTIMLRAALTEAQAPNRAIVIASHRLDEVQRTADFIVLLVNGQVRYAAAVAEAVSRFGSLDELFQAIVLPPTAASA
jgi:ABC-2 type transport system ATP-binding protein